MFATRTIWSLVINMFSVQQMDDDQSHVQSHVPFARGLKSPNKRGESLTCPTQCSLPSKLDRPALHLCLLGVALPICVEFRLQLGKLGLKLVEMCKGRIAFCLSGPSVSQRQIG
jgi:hypothetical protein